MRRALIVLAMGAFAVGAAGCGAVEDIGNISKALSERGKKEPDPVATNPPLAMPPEYGLRPPVVAGSATDEAERRARYVLEQRRERDAAGRAVGTDGRSAGEDEVLRRAGMDRTTSPVVRRTMDIEAEERRKEEERFTDTIIRYDPERRARDGESEGRDATGTKPVIR